MNEEIEFIIDSAKEQMQNAIEHLIKELRNIRAGKATPALTHQMQEQSLCNPGKKTCYKKLKKQLWLQILVLTL